ncbi:hypothetical protein [Ferdinandcohnia sp. Marseille-Q9671]
MELQTKDNRKYTNQLPKWAIGCHIGLISIFVLLGIGGFMLGAKEVSETGFGFFLLLCAFGVMFLGFAWFSYNNLRKYLDIVIHIHLGDNGYDYYVNDKKEDEEHYIFLPYDKMKYVLIGMDYRLQAQTRIQGDHQTRVKFKKVRSAKLFIYGYDSSNQVKVTSFPHASQTSLYDWIDVFQKHGVEIFHTDKALTATPSNPDVIESIPKEPFEGTLSFVMGSEADEFDNLFLTDQQQEIVEKKEKKTRKNGFIFTILLSILQIMMICFWFPNWDIVEASFGTNSNEFFALLLTVLLQFVIYVYMRRVKWYEPLRDSIILYIGVLIGILLSPDERPTFLPAVQIYAIMTIGTILFFFYCMKVYSWFKKFVKKLDTTSEIKKKDTHS